MDAATGAPLPYEGERSVLSVLEALVERHGWHAERETPGGPIIALLRAGASVTLEPGGQLELSGAPLENIHQTCMEMSGHLAELRDISNELGILWLGIGFHPFATQAELPWVPKQRYAIMRRYLPTRGEHGLDMMRRTATVQANFDYTDEEDAMRKLRVSLRLSPLVTAMFANSPFYEGAPLRRAQLPRQGLAQRRPRPAGPAPRRARARAPLRRLHRVGARRADVPRQARRGGDREHRPDVPQLHEATASTAAPPDARRTGRPTSTPSSPRSASSGRIEVRGADSLPASLVCALPALWTGHPLRRARARRGRGAHAPRSRPPSSRPPPRHRRSGALAATFRGAPLADLAERLVDIAAGGLERRARLNKDGKDERIHLAKLAALVEKGRCPADALVEGLGNSDADLRQEILARARI